MPKSRGHSGAEKKRRRADPEWQAYQAEERERIKRQKIENPPAKKLKLRKYRRAFLSIIEDEAKVHQNLLGQQGDQFAADMAALRQKKTIGLQGPSMRRLQN